MSSDQVFFVSPAEVNEWRAAGDAVIVDVREQNEWDQVRIPGAQLMPLSTFDPAKIPDPGAKHLVFHCKSGVRCGLAAEKARAGGFKGNIARLQGGILNWLRSGYEVEEG
ncbi:MAG: rhodanese-like domain-containing protein [Rhodospirillaceae bacterium]